MEIITHGFLAYARMARRNMSLRTECNAAKNPIVEDKASRLLLQGATLLRRGSLTVGNAVAEQNVYIAKNRDSHVVRTALLRMTEQAYHGNSGRQGLPSVTPRSNTVATWESHGRECGRRTEYAHRPKQRFSHRACRTPQNDRAGISRQ